MPALRNKPTTVFNVFDQEHVDAVQKVVLGGRVSDTELRFDVELPFTSVPTMAIHQMSQEYAKLMKGETSEKLIQVLANSPGFLRSLSNALNSRGSKQEPGDQGECNLKHPHLQLASQA